MSVLGLCHLNGLWPDSSNPGKAMAGVQICGVISGSTYGPVQSSVGNIDPATSSADLATTLASFAQSVLTNVAGYTFGVGDTVSVFGTG